MSKFKVGEKVKLIEVPELRSFNWYKNNFEKVMTVKMAYERSIDVAENPFSFSDAWLEPVTNSHELHITCNDGKTTNAVYKVNGKIEKRTEAVCAPSDTFDFATGAQTALDRVFPKAQPTQPIAPQEDKARFEVGQKVKVLDNNNAHGFRIGDIITLVNKFEYNEKAWYATSLTRQWIVFESDIEPYAEPEQPKFTVTREMLVKLGACTGGISTFDRLFPSGTGDLKDVCEQAEKCGHADYSSRLTSRKDRIGEMQNEQPKEAVKLYCVKDYKPCEWLTKGKIYELGEYGITYDNGWYNDMSSKPWSDRRLNSEPLSNYLFPLVSRPAKVGEWVLITNAVAPNGKYKNGDLFQVAYKWGNGINVGKPFDMFDSEYLVLDNYAPEPEKEPEPVYFSGKVVCVSDDNMYHTQGKAYTFIDGAVNTDKYGTYNPSNLAKTLEEFNKRNVPKFIPYLGEA